MKYLLILMLICFNIYAFDVDSTIKQLDDEDFNTRQNATKGLYDNCHIEDVNKLYKLSLVLREDFPETWYRINYAIKEIFIRNFISTDERCLRLKGSLRIDYDLRRNWPQDELNAIVLGTFIDSPAEGKLLRFDCIIKVDQWDLAQWRVYQYNKFNFKEYGFFIPNREYTITVKRPKNPDDLENRNGILSDRDEFTIEQVKVTACEYITLERQNLIDSLTDEEWENFKKDLTKQD